MLIEFQVENFRSFKGRQVFSMVADSFTEHAQTNTFDPGLKGFGNFLKTAAVYGPNAAGKTNLLRAIQFVKNFVVTSAATTSTFYPYDPFKFSRKTSEAPSEFQITFAHDGFRYEYAFKMGPKQIESERLIEYAPSRARAKSREMFVRTWDRRANKYVWNFSSFLKGQREVWSKSTRPNALFLSTAVQLNSTQLMPIFNWFQNRLAVVVGDVSLNQSLTLKLLSEPDGKSRLLPFLQEADLGISDVAVARKQLPSQGFMLGAGSPPIFEPPQVIGQAPHVVQVTLSHFSENRKELVGLDFNEESHGTQIVFKTAGAWLNVLKNGEVLLLDEIDTSLHPLLVRFLIKQFHSRTTNPNNAQLIFSTHNTSLLDQEELLRRDQIWFVEKDQSGASKLYSLTDFKPRNDESLERWYMRGRYGALPILPPVAK
jgi:AAA15 family ATPase/GTPase